MENATKYVLIETAKMLKELDFDDKCFGYYGNIDKQFYDARGTVSRNETDCIIAPSWWQVKEWLWDEHKINIEIVNVSTYIEGDGTDEFQCTIKKYDENYDYFDSVESPIEAERIAIKRIVELLYNEYHATKVIG